MKILTIIGTRPEAIKLAPVVLASKNLNIENKILDSGQHTDILDTALLDFDLKADYKIKLNRKSSSLAHLTSALLDEMNNIILQDKADFIFVQGDTTTAFIGALIGFYNKIPVGHIEAGLRSGDLFQPFPEEANRKFISQIANFHFAPTQISFDNLIKENISKDKIFLTGNTVIDALYFIKEKIQKDQVLKNSLEEKFKFDNKSLVLLTCHRRENHGENLEEICSAVLRLAKEDINFIFPVHPNPIVKDSVYKILGNTKNIMLTEPLNYKEMVFILDKCNLVLSDSGGLQEEAPSLGKRVLVLRETSERPEAILEGCAELIGTDSENIYKKVKSALKEEKQIKTNIYGDGKSAEKILQIIKNS